MRRYFSNSAALAKTKLHSYHVNTLKAKKMGDFCGFDMPIFYDNWGLIKEHKQTRDYAGVFDVSHMGQIKVYGSARDELVNRVFVADLSKLSPTQAC